ncbi:hypothetical protein AVEN_125114-1, partial [Araneus ventricosus]
MLATFAPGDLAHLSLQGTSFRRAQRKNRQI